MVEHLSLSAIGMLFAIAKIDELPEEEVKDSFLDMLPNVSMDEINRALTELKDNGYIEWMEDKNGNDVINILDCPPIFK